MQALIVNLHSNSAGLGSPKPEFLQVAVSAPTREKPCRITLEGND